MTRAVAEVAERLSDSQSSDIGLETLQACVGARYQVLRQLGRGGMAAVYLARDLGHERLIALKVVRAKLDGVNADERFQREIGIAARLQHPNILSLHDSGSLDLPDGSRRLYYTMPYVEGESLRRRLASDARPTIAETVRIVSEIADALAAAHAAGIVHRDLKPDNVLLSQGHAMVSDFGIAKAMSTSADDNVITDSNAIVGTPAYMAPEQAIGHTTLDHRVDLYALGLIAYELLAGSPPFGTGTPQQMLVAQVTTAPEPITKRVPGLDPALARLVMQLIEKRPADRPSSAAAVVRELDAIRTGRARRPRARRVGPVLAVLTAVVALAAYPGWMMTRASGGYAPRDRGAPDSTTGPSVAVLPFDNLSGDKQQEYLSDGISDQIIYALSSVRGLRVSPRAPAFAFRGRGAALREIGDKLHVTHVIEGSTRRAGNRLRVNVQLVNVASGNADWSEEYERDMSGVFEVQDAVARAIVGALRIQLAAGATALIAGAGTHDVDAYVLYLRGRESYEARTYDGLLKAEVSFRQAIEKDSSYARAYSGLSDTYAVLGIFGFRKRVDVLRPARDAANAAVRFDSTSAESWTSLGIVRLFYDWDWPGARFALEHAVQLDPRSALPRFWHAWYLVAANDLDGAVSEMRRAATIDPVTATTSLARMLALAGRDTEALVVERPTVALDASDPQAEARIAISSVGLHRCDDALRAITFMDGLRHSFEGLAIGYVLASCHHETEARALAADLERQASEIPSAPEQLAGIYATLGDTDRAFLWMERAYAERSGPLYKLRAEPSFANLRGDRRFQSIVTRMGLP